MVNYYEEFAAAFLRGSQPECPNHLEAEQLVEWGLAQGIRLQRYKRSRRLPRVSRVLGMLQALQPQRLLDLGTGRGVFLWPLLEDFPDLEVVCVDSLDYRVADLQALQRGGLTRVCAQQADIYTLPFQDQEFDTVTMLEVLEHIPDTQRALREVARVCASTLILSVPSHPDDNPEHLHLFTPNAIKDSLALAGFSRVKLEGVLNHFVVLAQR